MADEEEPKGWFFDDENETESQENNEPQQGPSPQVPPVAPPPQPPPLQQPVDPAHQQPQQPPQPGQPPQQPQQPQPPQQQQPGQAQPPQPPQPPQQPQLPQQPQPGQPQYVGQDPQSQQEVHSIFDVAGEKSYSDKPEPDVSPEEEEDLKREKRQQQIKLAIRGTLAFAGIIILIYAAMFIYRMVTNVTPGSSSPEAVIQSTFSAFEDKDVLGVLRQLDPHETEPLLENHSLFANYFQSNEEINDASQPLRGFDISAEGIETETTLYNDEIARVELVKGQISADVDETQLPRNSSLEGDELSNINIEELNNDWREGTLAPFSTDSFDESKLESKNVFYIAVKRDSRWYFSATYTFAEYARIMANAHGWDLGEPIFESDILSSRGGSTPEEAVRNLINATISVDSQRATDQFSPFRFPAIFQYRDITEKAEQLNSDNLYVRAVREGVKLNNLDMRVRDLKPDDQENPFRFVAINSLVLNVEYQFEVTTADLEKFGFVPYAAQMLINWDGQCLRSSGAYAVFNTEEIMNEAPEFPIIDANSVEFTSAELSADPDLALQIVFPVIDSQNNVFENVDDFNGGTSTAYTSETTEVDDRRCYRETIDNFPEVGVMTVREGSNYFVSPLDTLWHFASWLVTGNHLFE